MEGDAPPPAKKMKNSGIKKKQQLGDIVFTAKNGSIQTMPSLEKKLKTVTDPVIGLQFVWEYRSPSKSVPPHYLCKLCKVQRLQNEICAHINGWKHCFKYLKKYHPDKIPHEEETATKDPSIRRAIKETAAEVEKAEGRGKIKVVLKEPFEVPYFQGMPSAMVKTKMGPGIDSRFPRGFPEGMFPGNFPPRTMPLDFPVGMPMRRFPSNMPMGGDGGGAGGGFPEGMPMPHNNIGIGLGRPFPGTMPMRMPGDEMGIKMREGDMEMRRFPDDGPMRMGGEGFGVGPRGIVPGRRYPDDFQNNQLGSSNDRMMPGIPKGPESNSLPTTLLKYLDTFRIENENDAQIVLKVTQKLTDVLMEYRLRSVSSGPGLKNSTPMNSVSSMGSMNAVNSINFGPRSGGDRFSGGLSGSNRFYN